MEQIINNDAEMHKIQADIQTLGLNAIRDYFKIDMNDIQPKILVELHKKVKIAMEFSRELGRNKREIERNYLHIFKLIAEDKKELKQYIKTTMPKYNPI